VELPILEMEGEMMSLTEVLTDEQVENWRKILCLTLGPYALIAPREQIQEIRNKMQKKLSSKLPKCEAK